MAAESGAIRSVLDRLERSGRLNVAGLEGGASAYLASRVWAERKRPLVVVCRDAAEAASLEDDIGYFAGPEKPGPVKIFSAPSALPYTHLIPQADTWVERLSVLYTIENEDAPLIIAPIAALLRKVPPRALFYDHIEYLSIGQELDRESFLKRLVFAGYNNSPLVEEEGDFASRGYIIDIWSPVSDRPVRVELDNDKVASIRSFDSSTQRTSYSIDRITIVPVRSVILNDEIVSKGLGRLKKISDDIGVSVVERREYASSIRSGIYPAYTETLLPIFHPDAGYLWDYLDDALFMILEPAAIREEYQKFWSELKGAYSEAGHIERAVRPGELYKEYEGWERVMEGRPHLTVNGLAVIPSSFERRLSKPVACYSEGGTTEESPAKRVEREILRFAQDDIRVRQQPLEGEAPHDIRVSTYIPRPADGKWLDGSSKQSLDNFIGQLGRWSEERLKVIAVCHTPRQADRLTDLLRWQGLAPEIGGGSFAVAQDDMRCHSEAKPKNPHVTIGPLSKGFAWPDEKLVVLSESEMFGKKRKRLPAVSRYPTEAFTSYQDLTDGDYLVHIQHGVGRYRGMRQMEFSGMKNDFLQLEYLGGDRLYVPAYGLNQVQKYIGPGDGVPFLDKMGGNRWEKARLKADRAVRRIAKELLKLYATRKVREGYAFSGRDHLMEERPADRLICGDVGYGKTEVAMRAAFKAAVEGKQVVLLVPTTILAFQHLETFTNRFKNTPITIELLNRFKTRKEQTKVIEGVGKGQVDIVIGTHRLLQADVKVRDLGLLIIDEEHRFGVRQKEAIKRLKETVDVISMSATPIPRSLHISLVGARDISVINTPPADRLSIRTYVAEFDEGLIRGAVLKEIRRDGQVFFVHNRVETIESMKRRLERLLPEVRICVAHGQMKEHELEKIMVAFLKREYDLLLTTTIIESGLDIPTANTIIVNRADTFGLAQLYQLRGRVGRSNVQAFAYLIVPEEAAISAIATKRLATLQRYTELGAGFQIAMHDLEIRGAGNILGAEQSGHISAIGYELYTELLEREIRKLKGEEDFRQIETEIQIPVEAYLPADYIEDDGTRMVFYKRISAIRDEDGVDEIAKELEDRFGVLPEVAENLLKVVDIRVKAGGLGIESIQGSKTGLIYKFAASSPVQAKALLNLVANNQERMRIRPDSTIFISEAIPTNRDIFSYVRRHLKDFSQTNQTS